MPNHYLKSITENLPVMQTNWKGGRHNTNNNCKDFFKKLCETPEYKRMFDPKTGELTIWFVRSDDTGCKVSMCNTVGSCTIHIQYFTLGVQLSGGCHEFNPLGFSALVNAYLLTPDDLEQQRAFQQLEQERNDALKKAHYSSPQTCGGVDNKCDHCRSDVRWHQQFHGDGT